MAIFILKEKESFTKVSKKPKTYKSLAVVDID
jgi:hypothetical protein